MKKKMLFIAYFYPPVTGGGLPGAQRILRFIRYLSLDEAHVLTVKPECYPDYVKINNNVTTPVLNEIVHRTTTFNPLNIIFRLRKKIINPRSIFHNDNNCKNKNGLTCLTKRDRLQFIKDYISSLFLFPDPANQWFLPAILKGIAVIRRHNIDTIFATGMPWTSLIVGAFLKAFTRKRLIVEFRDPWVDNPYFKKNDLEKYLENRFELFVVSKADLVLVNTNSLKKAMEMRYPGMAHKIVISPNGYDTNDFTNIPDAAVSEGKFIISHAGTLYAKRDPISLLRAIEYLKKNYPETASLLEFTQIGEAHLDYDIHQLTVEKGIGNNLVMLEQMEHEKCLGYLATSDVLVIIQPGTKNQIPSKLYEYIYLEKPILTIGEKDGDLARLIIENNMGQVFAPDETEGIANCLRDMIEHKKRNGRIVLTFTDRDKFDVRNIVSAVERHIQLLKS